MSKSKRLALLIGLGITLLIVVGVMAGVILWTSPSAHGGDPGNVRLNALAADQVFASLPSGAQPSGAGLAKLPARYRAPAFEGAGWDGPAAKLTFTSRQSSDSVFVFFQAAAASAGWSPSNRNVSGYPQTWTKVHDGYREDLSLLVTDKQSDEYTLTASAPAQD